MTGLVKSSRRVFVVEMLHLLLPARRFRRMDEAAFVLRTLGPRIRPPSVPGVFVFPSALPQRNAAAQVGWDGELLAQDSGTRAAPRARGCE